jgi:hypothetical protein
MDIGQLAPVVSWWTVWRRRNASIAKVANQYPALTPWAGNCAPTWILLNGAWSESQILSVFKHHLAQSCSHDRLFGQAMNLSLWLWSSVTEVRRHQKSRTGLAARRQGRHSYDTIQHNQFDRSRFLYPSSHWWEPITLSSTLPSSKGSLLSSSSPGSCEFDEKCGRYETLSPRWRERSISVCKESFYKGQSSSRFLSFARRPFDNTW